MVDGFGQPDLLGFRNQKAKVAWLSEHLTEPPGFGPLQGREYQLVTGFVFLPATNQNLD